MKDKIITGIVISLALMVLIGVSTLMYKVPRYVKYKVLYEDMVRNTVVEELNKRGLIEDK